MEAGLGLKQTIVMQENLASHYGLNNGETLRFEGGLTTGITYQKEVVKMYNTIQILKHLQICCTR